MKTLIKFLTLFIFIGIFIACSEEPCENFVCEDEINEISINDLQILGSHNSYRLLTNDRILALAADPPQPLPEDFDPLGWDYYHLPLDKQFNDFGIRAIELDVYRDPTGGLFYYRLGNAMVELDPESNEPALLEPGLKVLHLPDFDYNTNYLSFKEAVNVVKSWSADHPNHLPITIMVEAKEDSPCELLGNPDLTCTLPFDVDGVEEIEDEISELFQNSTQQLITPDDVRGSYSTLNEAVLNNSWPALKDARGKIIFVLLGSDQVIDNYTTGNPSLANRNMFVFSEAGSPETAFIIIDDPQENFQTISNYVAEGYMVRTRADADTYEARDNSTQKMQSAFNSGAQLIYTDYYSSELNRWTNYAVSFPNNRLALYSSPIDNIDEDACFDPCDVTE